MAIATGSGAGVDQQTAGGRKLRVAVLYGGRSGEH